MDIFEETKLPLKGIWDDELKRQQSKILIMQAIAEATELPAKQVNDIFDKLDELLLGDNSDEIKKTNTAR